MKAQFYTHENTNILYPDVEFEEGDIVVEVYPRVRPGLKKANGRREIHQEVTIRARLSDECVTQMMEGIADQDLLRHTVSQISERSKTRMSAEMETGDAHTIAGIMDYCTTLSRTITPRANMKPETIRAQFEKNAKTLEGMCEGAADQARQHLVERIDRAFIVMRRDYNDRMVNTIDQNEAVFREKVDPSGERQAHIEALEKQIQQQRKAIREELNATVVEYFENPDQQSINNEPLPESVVASIQEKAREGDFFRTHRLFS